MWVWNCYKFVRCYFSTFALFDVNWIDRKHTLGLRMRSHLFEKDHDSSGILKIFFNSNLYYILLLYTTDVDVKLLFFIRWTDLKSVSNAQNCYKAVKILHYRWLCTWNLYNMLEIQISTL